MLKMLKVAANNEQQKDLAALAICGNNLEAIDVLQRLRQYCVNIGDLQHAEEIKQEIIRCQNEISHEVLEKALRSRYNT
jgi:hypothetical protein